MREPYHMLPKSNRSKIIRRVIIGVQVLVLVLTLATQLFDDTEPDPDPTPDAATMDVHPLGVYVDGAFRVHVMDDGVLKQHTTFARCGDARTVTLDHSLDAATNNVEMVEPVWIDLPELGIEFTAGDYYIISSNSRFQMHFDNGDTLTLTLSCPPTVSTAD